jgi:hypothetical protein
MKVAIIGSGRIGGQIGVQAARAGHEVIFSYSRDPRKLEDLAATAPGARAAVPADAVGSADVVVLSVPWSAIDDALARTGSLAGKVVVDTTNQFGAQGVEALPDDLTAIETNARRMAGARLAKAFNTLTAGYQRDVAAGRVDGPVAMFFASEDEAATSAAEDLIRACGFEPVRIGGWHQARTMEAPRRDGAIYGEAYRPDDARRIASAAADDLDRAGELATELRIE